MTYWTDKVALVTGGSSGLGCALAEAFAARGAKVAIAARGADRLNEAAVRIRAHGHDVLALPTDVTRQQQVDAMVASVVEHFGRLDVLVNNVGRSARGEILATTPDDFAELMDLNLLAAVRATRAAAPHLLASRGHLVNIGSLAAKSASRYLGAYPATKFALAAYTQQLRLELSPRGLHVLLVCPGPIARDSARDGARDSAGYDAGARYDEQTAGLPVSARKPGGGVKVRALSPRILADRVLRACERRRPELVIPWKARLLFAIAQLSPTVGDWLVRRMT